MSWNWLGFLFPDFKKNHTPDNENNIKIDYFRDKSLTRLSDDKFNHKHYVKVLIDIITKCETPINVGLYGRWGVGKSSILDMLEDEIKNGTLSSQFRYVKVDAWGLSSRSLKQEVLVAINESLKSLPYATIENKLYGIEEGTFLDIRSSWKRLITLFGVFTISMILGYVILSSQNLWKPENIIPIIGYSSLATIAVSILNFVIRPSKRIVPQKESSFHFSQIYQKMINKEMKKRRKLIVVIDNLDRCEDKMAVNLLGLIQTFMTRENCINILACDDEAIVNHLRRVKGSSYTEREGNEFLSKFFQVTIRIPQFIPENLESYVVDLMKQRSIPFNQNVKGILIAGAVRNPRKVNQFLNNLVASYRLAEFKESKDGTQLRSGTLTSHPDIMVKMIIIRHEWPVFHKALEKDPTMLDVTKKEYQDWINKMSSENEPQVDGLNDFLNATQPYFVDDIGPFIRLNQEAFDAHLPDVDRFEINVRTNNTKAILDTLKQANDEEKSKYIKKIISINKRIIEKEKSGPNLLNTTQALLTALENIEDSSLIHDASNNLGQCICSGLIPDALQQFDLNKIFDKLNNMEKYYASRIYEIYVKLLVVNDVINEPLLKKFLENNISIPSSILDNLDATIITLFAGHEAQLLDIIKQICSSDKWTSNKFSKPPKFIQEFIARIVFDGSEIDNKRLEIYHTINKDISEVIIFLTHLKKSIISHIEPPTPIPIKCIEEIERIDLNDKDLESPIVSLFSSLTKALNTIQDLEQKKTVVEILIKFLVKLGVEND
ncbi:MAG: P-loop NTPase fold protein [Candidatus Nitrosotenuis sp.]